MLNMTISCLDIQIYLILSLSNWCFNNVPILPLCEVPRFCPQMLNFSLLLWKIFHNQSWNNFTSGEVAPWQGAGPLALSTSTYCFLSHKSLSLSHKGSTTGRTKLNSTLKASLMTEESLTLKTSMQIWFQFHLALHLTKDPHRDLKMFALKISLVLEAA